MNIIHKMMQSILLKVFHSTIVCLIKFSANMLHTGNMSKQNIINVIKNREVNQKILKIISMNLRVKSSEF